MLNNEEIHSWEIITMISELKGSFLQIGSAVPTLLQCYLPWEDYISNFEFRCIPKGEEGQENKF